MNVREECDHSIYISMGAIRNKYPFIHLTQSPKQRVITLMVPTFSVVVHSSLIIMYSKNLTYISLISNLKNPNAFPN